MKEWLEFLAALATPLYELFQYSRRPKEQLDPEEEKQIAGRIVRAASDERMKRDLEGGQ